MKKNKSGTYSAEVEVLPGLLQVLGDTQANRD